MKTFKIILLFICTISIARANYYSESVLAEYNNGNKSNSDLKSFIGKSSKVGFKPLGYKRNAKNNLFGYVDLKKDDRGYYVFDVYCRKKIRANTGPMRIPTNKIMNTEHSWPQSHGAKVEPLRGDLHHLFPTDSRANSTRGNLPFSEVDGADAHSNCSASQRGKAISLNNIRNHPTTTVSFEPPHEIKGDIARALFYVASKYNMAITPLEEQYLRKWNIEDIPDADEISRNDRIEEVQGNRNPFVDFPYLVERIENF